MKSTIEEYAAGGEGKAVVVKRLTYEDGKLVDIFVCPHAKGGAKIEELKAYANEQIKIRRVENTPEKPTLEVSEEEIQAQANFYLSAGWQPEKVRQAINSGLIRDMIVEERLAEVKNTKEKQERDKNREEQAAYNKEWQARYGEETKRHDVKMREAHERHDKMKEEKRRRR